MKIILSIPSRGRPQQLHRCLQQWKKRASDAGNVHVTVGTDPDDPWADEYERILTANGMLYMPGVEAAGRSKVEAINATLAAGTDKMENWDMAVIAADDMIPIVDGWDWAIRQTHINPSDPRLIWYDDGRQNVRCTIPVITRAWYEKYGYCYHPSYKSYYCLPGESLIYMGDQSFKRIEDVRTGDIVVGTESRVGRGRQRRTYLTPARVTGTKSREATLIKITLASGKTLRCTPDHRWAHYKQRAGIGSRFGYSEAFIGMQMMLSATVPEEPPKDAESQRILGWLGGMYDGEGCWPYICQSRSHNPTTWNALGAALARFGFEFSRTDSAYCVKGSRPEYLRFLNWTKPIRTETRAIQKALFTARFGTPDEIVDIQPDSIFPVPVYCLTTTTGNFVADGYLSHNCDDEQTQQAMEAGELVRIMGPMFLHNHACFGAAPDDETYQRNRRYKDEDRKNFQIRKQWQWPKENP